MEKFVRKKCTEDLTGKVFGKLTVLEFANYGKKGAQWLCQCECENIKIKYAIYLKNGDTTSCGDCNSIHTGDKFGKLTVLKFVGYKNHKAKWLCQCTCGNKKEFRANDLKNNKIVSCDNCNPIRVGDNFGKLTVLKFAGYTNKSGCNRPQWLCQCECGNKKTIQEPSLKRGDTKSCGDCNPIHIGDKFGKLTVLKFDGYKKQKDGKALAQWLCRCECGNTKFIKAHALKSSNTKSCGCSTKIYSKKHKKWFRSSWELNFAIILDHLEIKWWYEPKKFKLSNNKKYIPDFYLPEFNMFIEIKGWWREDKKGFSISKEKNRTF